MSVGVGVFVGVGGGVSVGVGVGVAVGEGVGVGVGVFVGVGVDVLVGVRVGVFVGVRVGVFVGVLVGVGVGVDVSVGVGVGVGVGIASIVARTPACTVAWTSGVGDGGSVGQRFGDGRLNGGVYVGSRRGRGWLRARGPEERGAEQGEEPKSGLQTGGRPRMTNGLPGSGYRAPGGESVA